MSRPIQLLLVDDSRTVRRIIREEFSRVETALGALEILEAADGVEALQLLAVTPDVDLILSDWNMPRMDGLDFVRAVRAIPALAETPILMITVHHEKDDVLAAVRSGVSGYLVKPFTGEQLLTKVAALLKYRRR